MGDPAAAPLSDCQCQPHVIPAGAPGCWYVWSDPKRCPMRNLLRPAAEQSSLGSGYQLRVDRGGCAGHWPACCPTAADGCLQ